MYILLFHTPGILTELFHWYLRIEGARCLNELGIWITPQLIQAYYQYGVGWRPALYITKKGALDSQPPVIKLTICLPMFGGSLRVFRLLPSLKLVAMI